MSDITLSVIIPTLGRDTLTRTIESAQRQMLPGDEIMVSRNDTPWGGQARNKMMMRAAGTHLTFMDDDDRYTPHAFEAIRRGVASAPYRLHIFKMRYANGTTIWGQRKAVYGNVGTPMMVAPNNPRKLGSWSDKHETDWDFCRSTLEATGLDPVFHESVIALIKH